MKLPPTVDYPSGRRPGAVPRSSSRHEHAVNPIYHAGGQLPKVRFVQSITVATAAAVFWGGVESGMHYGLHPTEGGALAPLAIRALIGGAFFIFGIVVLAGIWAHGECYVTYLAANGDGRSLKIRLAGLFRRRMLEIDLDTVSRPEFRHGEYDSGKLRVNAPWFRLDVAGRRLPLIIDAQGEFLDQARFESLGTRSFPSAQEGTGKPRGR